MKKRKLTTTSATNAPSQSSQTSNPFDIECLPIVKSCESCKKKFDKNSKKFDCSECGRYFHSQCLQQRFEN